MLNIRTEGGPISDPHESDQFSLIRPHTEHSPNAKVYELHGESGLVLFITESTRGVAARTGRLGTTFSLLLKDQDAHAQ